MKNIIGIILLVLISLCSRAQQNAYVESYTSIQADSLKRALLATNNDTLKMKLARELGVHYQERYRDSSFFYHEQQLSLARKLNQKLWQADALDQAGWALSQLKIYPRSLQYFSEAIRLLEDPAVEKNIWHIELFSPQGISHNARMTVLGFIKNDFSQLFDATGEINKEMSNLFEGISIGKSINNQSLLGLINANLAKSYLTIGNPDSAIICGKMALLYMDSTGYTTYKGYALMCIGNSYLAKEDYKLAKEYFENAIHANQQYSVGKLSDSYLSMARLYQQLKQPDSSIHFGKQAAIYSKEVRNYELLCETYSLLYDVFNMKANKDSAFVYIQRYKTLSDSLNKAEKIKIYDYLNLGFTEQAKLQELEKQYIIRGNKIRTYSLLAGILICLLIAFLLLRNNSNRKKANMLLQQQKQKVESALSELTSTQAQLIQAEKMASLGELTAGIAHEIQNPLNFVNNFSEVNTELSDELEQEADKGNIDEIKIIAKDIKANSEKINYHGKRADAIVKGMLQHSRSATGEKGPADINALAGEYLKLAYQSLKGKDNSFTAELKTEFDESIGDILIIPQDIGRVLLNLYNNAFYTVHEKTASLRLRAASYEPIVTVSTRKRGNTVEIRVKDNGNGIPQKIIDKIFQPFFTTKPTGQGTGLGLSLSYDIVKAHGGEIKVNTKENEGTEFTIVLPK